MTEENPEITNEEVEEEVEEEDTEEIVIDKRLQKSVERLKKITKIKKEALEGLTLEEQFDRLSFMVDNKPTIKKTKNKPIIGLPNTEALKIGRIVKNELGGSAFMIDPLEWLKSDKKK